MADSVTLDFNLGGNAREKVKELGTGISTLTSKASGMSKTVRGFASGAAQTLSSFTKEAFRASDGLGELRSEFEALTGSASATDKLVSDINELANATPLENMNLAQNVKTLLAFGSGLENVNDEVRRLGDLAGGDQKKLNSLTSTFGKLQAKGKASMGDINKLTEAGVPILKSLAKQYGTNTNAIIKMVSAGKIGFQDVKKSVVALTSEGGQFFNSMDRKSKKLSNNISGVTKAVKGLVTGLLVFKGAQTLTSFTKEAFRAASGLEDLRTEFEVLTGSASATDKLVSDINELANATPLENMNLAQNVKTLLAFGSGLENVNDEVRRLGDLAGGDQERLNRLTDAFGKLQAKGKASMEEINRFTEAGVPILKSLADQYGTNTSAIIKMVSAGKIGFEDVKNSVVTLTSEGGQFFNLMEKKSQTLSGKISTLSGTIKNQLGESFSGALEPSKGLLDDVLQLVKDNEQSFKEFGNAVGSVIKSVSPGLIKMAQLALDIAVGFTKMVDSITKSSFGVAIEKAEKNLDRLGFQVEESTDRLKAFEKAINDAGESGQVTFEGQVLSVSKANKLYDSAWDKVNNLSIQYETAKGGVDKFNESMGRTPPPKEEVESGITGIGNSASQSSKKVEELNKNLKNTFTGKTVGVRVLNDNEKSGIAKKQAQKEEEQFKQELKSMQDREEQRLMLLNSFATTEEDREIESLERRKARLQDFGVQTVAIEKEISEKKMAIANKVFQDRENAERAVTDVSIKAFGQVVNAFATANKDKLQSDRKYRLAVKAGMISEAVANGAVAIGRQYRDLPLPLAIPSSILVGAATGVQIATIKNQKFADGGIVGGNSFSGDKQNIQADSGEMVINRADQTELFNMIKGGGGGGNTYQIIMKDNIGLDEQKLARLSVNGIRQADKTAQPFRI